MKTNSKILIALGAGLAVGGLLGILFAPAKGKETRKKIADTGKKLTDNVKGKLGKGKERIAGLREEVKERMDAVNDKLKEFA